MNETKKAAEVKKAQRRLAKELATFAAWRAAGKNALADYWEGSAGHQMLRRVAGGDVVVVEAQS